MTNSGLPGGNRNNNGTYNNIGNNGNWWSSTQNSTTNAWNRNLVYLSGSVNRFNYTKRGGFSVRCVRDVVPTLNTTSVSGISGTTANSGGTITDAGGDSVTVRGVVWSTTPGPTVALPTKTSNGTGTGSFTSNLSGLNAGTTYYVRAYATNGVGTGYGNEITFTTLAAGQFTDIDGNIYDTVAIGTQVWMSKNLRVSKYRNGDSIPTNLSNSTWQNTTSGAYAIYNNDPVNDSIYGKLYNWYAVADPRGLCPTGWHVPSDAEWTTLENFLGGSSVAGGAMKAVSPLWLSPNTGATNSSGFSGLPGGVRSNFGTYVNFGNGGFWWSSTQNSTTNAWLRDLSYANGDVYRSNTSKSYGFSVRCVRDVVPTLNTTSVSGITGTTANSGGNIPDAGGDSVTVRGLVWSTSPNPTIALPTKTTDGSGTGSFTSNLSGLNAGTTYYVRAYATNAVGTAYGNEISFSTLNLVTDVDGNTYDTVVIGTQVWMSKNLRVSKYRNGDPIPTNLSNTTWENTTSGAYAIYNNTAANDSIYGKLYNWYAVADPRGLCPVGWHVPSDAEWQTLETALGMPAGELNNTGQRGSAQNVGGQMKSVSPLWLSPNTGATNSSGFSGLPGGLRDVNGAYNTIGNFVGFWWSSAQDSAAGAWYRYLDFNYGGVYRFNGTKRSGFSVRCVRD